MDRREQVLEKVRSIPSIPTAANRMMSLLKDPEVDINVLIRTIEFDPGLTTNVLRLANSAYFGGPRTIASLRDALVRLGMNRVFQLVMMTAIVPIARQELKGYVLPPGKLLEHSIVVAVGAEELARKLRLLLPAHAFTAGLLHDLGKVILGTFVEVDANAIVDLAFGEKVSFEVAERQVLGIDHAEAGAELLECWNLPLEIVEVVRNHHQPDVPASDQLVVDLVHAADRIAVETGFGMGIDGLNYRYSNDVIARLKLRPATAEAVACRMISGLEEFRAITNA